MSRAVATAPGPAEGRGAGGPGAGGARLGKPADNSSRRRERRSEAMRTRARLWEFSSLPRVRACGRVPTTSGGGAVLRLSEHSDGERRAGVAGLQSCGSPWACPVCSRKISAERSREVAQVLRTVAERNGSAALVTLTMRHREGDRLDVLWDALSHAWGAVTSGRGWVNDRERFGIVGWLRAVEVTHGAHGWHVHVHAVVVLDAPTSLEMMEALGDRMFARWEAKLQRLGLSAVADRGGLDVTPVQLTGDNIEAVSAYVTKASLEVTAQTAKQARNGNRTPFAILRDFLATGLADDGELWLAWERASHGRRQLTWSRDLRAWARLHRERSDEEVASEDLGGEDAIILPPETWAAVRSGGITDLLDALELGGVPAAEKWLRSRSLAYVLARSGSSVGEQRPTG